MNRSDLEPLVAAVDIHAAVCRGSGTVGWRPHGKDDIHDLREIDVEVHETIVKSLRGSAERGLGDGAARQAR